MKQVLLDLKTGKIFVDEVPAPTLRRGGVLVKNYCSVISAGTELNLIKFAKRNIFLKAKERPDLAKKVFEKAKRDGWLTALQQAMRRLEKPMPLGYSSAGIVIKVSPDIVDIKPGDRVACAGAEYANHAEVVFVPKNLCVKIPDNVSFKHAAFTTLGAIAMQGIRNADIHIGENVAIIGLGLIGLLTIQIAKAAGCSVIGIDVNINKLKLAEELGANHTLLATEHNIEGKVNSLTNGFGVDATIITAATSSNMPIILAGKITREKGKVVVVGDVGLEIPREIYYKKELELVISRSYGPGRYNKLYEEKGVDYPIAYVRWTENRNMQAFLKLLSQGKINIDKLITHEYPVEKAEEAYKTLLKDKNRIAILIKYEIEKPVKTKVTLKHAVATPQKSNVVKIGVIGAGVHATATILPILSKLSNVDLIGIASATGLSAKKVAEKYKFKYATSDYNQIINDPNINAVLILTRNNLHAPLTIKALKAGKHVFVEKPLALTIDELNEIVETWKQTNKLLMVGYNRRYAPMTKKILMLLSNRKQPLIAIYRINAEKIPQDHWIYDPNEGGGRLISEACHFIDYIQYIAQSPITQIKTQILESPNQQDMLDNFIITLKLKDGSIGAIIYTCLGDRTLPKEYLEVHTENSTIILDNYRILQIMKNGKKTKVKTFLSQDKGHLIELKLFAACVMEGKRLEEEFKLATLSTLFTLKAKEVINKESVFESN